MRGRRDISWWPVPVRLIIESSSWVMGENFLELSWGIQYSHAKILWKSIIVDSLSGIFLFKFKLNWLTADHLLISHMQSSLLEWPWHDNFWHQHLYSLHYVEYKKNIIYVIHTAIYCNSIISLFLIKMTIKLITQFDLELPTSTWLIWTYSFYISNQ